VGFTHRDDLAGAADLPGPRPQLFFAPDRLEQRRRVWTPDGLMERLGEAWRAILEPARDPERGWLRIQRGRGPDAIARIYDALAAGRVRQTRATSCRSSERPAGEGAFVRGGAPDRACSRAQRARSILGSC
jgi:hypothetical protein